MAHVKKHGTHYGHEQTRQDDDIGQRHRPSRTPGAALKKLGRDGRSSARAGAGSRGR